MTRKVNILACGGFGSNTMLQLMKRPIFELLKDNLNLYALDTSQSNLKRFNGVPGEELIKKHLVENADGSGKHRAENYEQITTMVNDLANAGEIEGLVIIISSASGGSGAMIAAEAQDVLVKRKKPVVSMILGTDEDSQALGNTVKTIKTYQHKAAQGTKNFAMFYGENRNAQGQIDEAAADEMFVTNLEDLIMVGHADNEDLDSKDIYHWLNFPINQAEPGAIRFVTLLSRKEEEVFPEDIEVPVSSLSLLSKRGVTPQFVAGTGYSTRGFVAKELAFSGGVVEVQYQLHSGKAAKLANQLVQRQKTYTDIAARQAEAAAGDEIKRSSNDTVGETGAFL